MDNECCCCCGMDFESLRQSSSRKKSKDSAKSYRVTTDDMIEWILENRESVCRKKGFSIRLELTVSLEAHVCSPCRTPLLNNKRKVSRSMNESRVLNIDSSSSENEDTIPSTTRQIIASSGNQPSLYELSTSHGLRPPPIDIQELSESFSETSILSTPTEARNRRKFARFSSPRRQPSSSSSRSSDNDDGGDAPINWTPEPEPEPEPEPDRRFALDSAESDSPSDDDPNDSPSSKDQYIPPARRERPPTSSRVRATTSSGNTCVFGCGRMTRSRVIGQTAGVECIIDHSIFIPVGTRCCRHHPDTSDEYAQLQPHRDTTSEEKDYTLCII